MHSWGHHLPTQSPELKETGKAPTQARDQVKLWLQASSLRVLGACKKEGEKKKEGGWGELHLHPKGLAGLGSPKCTEESQRPV